MIEKYNLILVILRKKQAQWRRGVAIECRTCDQEVVGSSLSRAVRRINAGQVSYTYVPLLPSSTRNSSGDEIANVNFLYDDIVHAVKIQ